MKCNHEKIKSVNCKIYCLYCGEELPIDYIIGKKKIEQQNNQENGENPPENAPETQQTDEQTSAPAEAAAIARETIFVSSSTSYTCMSWPGSPMLSCAAFSRSMTCRRTRQKRPKKPRKRQTKQKPGTPGERVANNGYSLRPDYRRQ